MNIIKNIRAQHGYTQDELAKKTGLSLRTIQRIEATNKEPKGHTLTVLSAIFNMQPSELQDEFKIVEHIKKSETTAVRIINMGILTFIGIPFGNLLVPIYLWKKNRTSKFVDELGKRIINFQIIWSVVLCMLMILSPFISRIFFSNTPIILLVLLIAYVFNIGIVCHTALKLQRDDFNFLQLPIRFI